MDKHPVEGFMIETTYDEAFPDGYREFGWKNGGPAYWIHWGECPCTWITNPVNETEF